MVSRQLHDDAHQKHKLLLNFANCLTLTLQMRGGERKIHTEQLKKNVGQQLRIYLLERTHSYLNRNQ